ncbi:MAG: hydrolase [Flavobacteriaceae bacterium]|nr:hydrolase [Flavobacteriaceae bacterium]|tara:strand:+ start:476 stop:973 length:498 start_codon:yes stop_codon:yes gene_type:complete
MKKNILLYLFLFTALILIFQMVNAKRVFADFEHKINTTKSFNSKLKDSIFQISNRLEEEAEFILEGNDYAMRVFENYPFQDISSRVMDALYETNLLRDKNNLIPYATMERTFLINKVRVLNHRWALADFTDGNYWGEIFLTYEIDRVGDVNFELKEHFLYPNPDQ